MKKYQPFSPYIGVAVDYATAIRYGMKKYYTGQSCRNGHHAERHVGHRNCLLCREQWQSENKARIAKIEARKYRKRVKAHREANIKWKLANPDRVKTHRKNMNHKRRMADGKFSHEDIIKIGKSQKWKCINCLSKIRDRYEIDHIIPIKLGGSSWPSNLQLLCMHCNRSKGPQHPEEWAMRNGRLF